MRWQGSLGNNPANHNSAINLTANHRTATDLTVNHNSATDQTANHNWAIDQMGNHSSAIDQTVKAEHIDNTWLMKNSNGDKQRQSLRCRCCVQIKTLVLFSKQTYLDFQTGWDSCLSWLWFVFKCKSLCHQT